MAPDDQAQIESTTASPAIDAARYASMYAASVSDPNAFWAEQAQRVEWIRPFSVVRDASFDVENVSIKWFEDGLLNVCANCVDRHVPTRGAQTAIIWEGDDIQTRREISYRELQEDVSRFGNVLKDLGVGRGDRVIIYLPMIPEAAVAMLACARIGAVHSVVFAGFSADALADRVNDCGAKVVITADFAPRGGRVTKLKDNANVALQRCDDHVKCLVVRRTGGQVAWNPARDVWFHEAAAKVSADCPPEPMGAEDPLFILYTSGSTGKPKGVVHTSGGYLVYAAMTHEIVFDYREGDVFWCTADVG
ncbi:MAG: AMP-binding protein, partial [Pseudomonadota bacterium]